MPVTEVTLLVPLAYCSAAAAVCCAAVIRCIAVDGAGWRGALGSSIVEVEGKTAAFRSFNELAMCAAVGRDGMESDRNADRFHCCCCDEEEDALLGENASAIGSPPGTEPGMPLFAFGC